MTASSGCSTTRWRAGTSARARPTCTGWPSSPRASSTRRSRRACRSPASTAGSSRIGRSAARSSRARSTRAGRPVSSCCSARIRRCEGGGAGGVTVLPRREMLDLIVVDGRARGVVARDLVSGALEAHLGDAVVLATGGYATYISCPPTPRPRTPPRSGGRTGAGRRSPTRASCSSIPPASRGRRAPGQAHPDVRVAAQRRARLGAARAGDDRRPEAIPEAERDYFLERRYPRYGNLVPRDLGLARGQGGVRRGPRGRAGRPRRVSGSARGARRGWAPACCASATATSSSCISASPATIRCACPCASPRPRTTPWAGSGWTTTS